VWSRMTELMKHRPRSVVLGVALLLAIASLASAQPGGCAAEDRDAPGQGDRAAHAAPVERALPRGPAAMGHRPQFLSRPPGIWRLRSRTAHGLPFATYALGIGPADTLAGGNHALARWVGSQWDPLDHTTSVRSARGIGPVMEVFPNPSRDRVRVGFVPVSSGSVHMAICDASGRVVFRRFGSALCGRPLELAWDGTDPAGRPVSAGSYWVRLSGESGNAVRHFVVVR
jgi:hypothetical protein